MSVTRTFSFVSVILIVSFISCAFGQSCSRSTTCISIYDCPPILNTIQQTITPSQAENLRSLACTSGPGRYPYVCCPRETSTPTPPRSIIRPSNGLGNVLPSRGSCGFESFSQRIFGGHSTDLDEFPWMALLEYSKPNSINRTILCGGSLINQRYILTAAHCLVGEIKRIYGNLVNVRLGEYDISNTTDCIETDCADPIKNIGIEETIVHPNYIPSSQNQLNDIGLVRLAEDVSYSDFIKPVCLPTTLGASRSEAMTSVQVAGWGRTLDNRTSNTKQKLEVPIYDHSQCKQKFATIRVSIDDSQICAGGVQNEDACRGDSGGPLMKSKDNFWVVEGIVSYGLRLCGQEGWPGIYTRVSSFEDWIQANMRP